MSGLTLCRVAQGGASSDPRCGASDALLKHRTFVCPFVAPDLETDGTSLAQAWCKPQGQVPSAGPWNHHRSIGIQKWCRIHQKPALETHSKARPRPVHLLFIVGCLMSDLETIKDWSELENDTECTKKQAWRPILRTFRDQITFQTCIDMASQDQASGAGWRKVAQALTQGLVQGSTMAALSRGVFWHGRILDFKFNMFQLSHFCFFFTLSISPSFVNS